MSLVESELPKLLHRLVEEVDPTAPHIDQIAALSTGMVRFVVMDPALYRSLSMIRRVREAHSEFVEAFGRIYAAGVEAGELRSMSVDLVSRLLQDLIMSGARFLITQSRPTDRMEEATSALREFIVHGLSMSPGEESDEVGGRHRSGSA